MRKSTCGRAASVIVEGARTMLRSQGQLSSLPLPLYRDVCVFAYDLVLDGEEDDCEAAVASVLARQVAVGRTKQLAEECEAYRGAGARRVRDIARAARRELREAADDVIDPDRVEELVQAYRAIQAE